LSGNTPPYLHHEIDHRRQLIYYKNEKGVKLFTDTGPRIEIHERTTASVEAALRIAAQKYGAVGITGSAAFREQAARQAARLGIQVRDKDLQQLWQEERVAKRSTHRQERARRPLRQEHEVRPESKSIKTIHEVTKKQAPARKPRRRDTDMER
jgi:hypothetical protein